MRISDWSSDVCSSDLITAQADIVFDDNESILTNVWSNTLDDDLPTGAITTAPASSSLPLTLSWQGSDPTSAARSYDLLVRLGDEGAFVPLKRRVPGTSTTVTSEDLRFGQPVSDGLGRKSVVWGTSVSVGVDRGGRGLYQKNK